jgi:DNA-binding NtrC family response regulator
MIKGDILIIDDEVNIIEGLKKILELSGHKITGAKNGKEGFSLALQKDFDMIITDLKMPELDGESFLKQLLEIKPYLKVIILTGHGSIQNAVNTMRLGAFDFFIKPFDTEKLLISIQHGLKERRLEQENFILKSYLNKEKDSSITKLMGKSKAMKQIVEIVKQVAKTQTTVLIEGESGTGKEVVARSIHELSDRANNPLIMVNCAAINENLFESELFGHEKGAFTGAIAQKKGRFELASGGTLFLDEIGEIPLHIQVKLLRVLQEKSFERVGGESSISIDVRIISATNKNLYKEVIEGRFRNDLYYRLNVVNIKMPALRDRHEDLPILINQFIKEFATINNKDVEGISPEALKILQKYKWPGNIRELRNTIEGMVVLSHEPILTLDYLSNFIKNSKNNEFFEIMAGTPLQEVEKAYILKVLELHDQNKSKSAEVLGIGRKTLQRKLKEYEDEKKFS